MAFYIDESKVVSETKSVQYSTSRPFQKVLQTLPEQKPVPPAIVMLGVLTEQLVPTEASIDEHVQLVTDKVDEAPTAVVPPETVEGIEWLLAQVADSLQSERKRVIGRLVAEAQLDTPRNSNSPIKGADDGPPTHADDTPNSSAEASETRGTLTDTAAEDDNVSESPPGERNGADIQGTITDQPASNKETTAKYTTSPEGPLSHNRDGSEGCIESDGVTCEFCNTRFPAESDLISHLSSCEDRPSDAHYECHYCGNKYILENKLAEHLDECREKLRETSHETRTSDGYNCSECGESFDLRREMIRHEYSCTDTTSSQQSLSTSSSGFIERGTTGLVSNFEPAKGYGFINMSDRSEDIFFHVSEYDGSDLEEGDHLEFDIKQGNEGLKAINISDVDTTTGGWNPTFAGERPRWGNDT